MKKLILIISIFCLGQLSFGQSFGYAISLNGEDDYGIVPHDMSLDPYDGSWSMTCWIKAANKNQIAPIVMKRDPQSPWTQYSYAFGLDDPHEPQPGKRIRVNHIEAAGGLERSGYTTNEVIDGNWHHIAIIADKVQDGIIIYLDGSTIDFIPLYYYGAWPDVHTNYDLIIAKGSGGDKIEGLIDELSLWNRVLSQSEVQGFMNNPIPADYYQVADSGLMAYYRFEQFEDLGIGASGINDIRDLSIHENHMSTEGMPVLVPSISLAGLDESEYNLIYFDLYPNPCEDMICLRYAKSEIRNPRFEAIDISGRVVKSMVLTAQETQLIDVSELQAGVYFIKLEEEGAVGVTKLIIK